MPFRAALGSGLFFFDFPWYIINLLYGHYNFDISKKRGVSMGRTILFVLLVLLLLQASAFGEIAEPYTDAELDSGYTTIVDDKGRIVFQTGLSVRAGDEFINEDNNRYEIHVVEGTLAKARFVGNESLGSLQPDAVPVQAPADAPKPIIAIYHTHTDEAYIPSDGKASFKGKGTITEVGGALARRLSELGYEPAHDQTLHNPHDANAYQRSRRTFMKLLEKQPVAFFDIHRDSAPLPAYKTTINGQDATKILLVVGRQNQNRATTMNYAKSIKAAADAKYKGLIRGIFIAHGNYNQDLNPRTMLIEIGTQYNSREAAEYSATLFADIVPSFLSASAGNVAQAGAANGAGITYMAPTIGGFGNDMLFLIGALVAGAGAFLFLSTGSWQEAKQKLSDFRNKEFGDLFRFGKKRK